MKARFNLSELVLLLATVVLSVSLALVIIRWLAPGLLGAPDSLKLVKLDRAVPPFYENIFREEDWASTDYLIQDPIVQVRAKPLFFDLGSIGPNDLLGFRNKAVPISADVITIGDSQTYGNNVLMWENWPHVLESMLPQGASVYSFATGGWGGTILFYVSKSTSIFSTGYYCCFLYRQ